MNHGTARRVSLVVLLAAWVAIIVSLPAPGLVQPPLFRSKGHTPIYECVELLALFFFSGQPDVFSGALVLGVFSFIVCPLFIARTPRTTLARVILGVLLCVGLAAPWIAEVE
jgi:hypothetical protein